MELRHLRYFLAVAEESSFTRAARRLHVSQPALSQQIRAAEKLIGTPLFHRDMPGVRLTAAGEALLEPAGDALAVVADGVRAARAAARADGRAVLRVGLPWAEVMGELTQPILATYAKAYPDTQLLFSSLDPAGLYNGLRDNTIDIALARLPLDPEFCAWTPLFEDRRVAAVGTGNPFFDAEYVEIEDIVDMPIPDVVFKSPAPELYSYWTLEAERGARARISGNPVSSTIEVSYALVHEPDLVIIGPETIRRFPALPQSFLRFAVIADARPNRAVVARRRTDDRPAVLRFCEVAAAVARHLGPVLLPRGTTLCVPSGDSSAEVLPASDRLKFTT
ncbi:LysR family transcriptional regulator [Amycolatopsis vastitatis]|uniref:HTH lysR-type domain-containing protein n=1 Tax=Amycolatopsis vastitatis TaxID=1905142 RepID=A0A229TBV0_9PSEU|nr:LysR family transcriptional regulator [Amycolatopsis vastitatis]OXM68209.1 hypothetical protein CF165_13750 [Amycolatopsis vastitatis]